MVLVKSVGVIGLDPVGGTVVRRLLGQGIEVTAHDPDPWTVATMTPSGATPARIPADAAEPADMVFVHVPDPFTVDEVLFDCGGVGETLRDGGFVVTASAIDATSVLLVAERLAALGLRTVEAWFTGLSDGIPDTVLVGCAPEELEALTPVLGMIAANVARIGPLGSVSALRSGVAALTRVKPLLSEDGSNAAADVLLRVLTGPAGDAFRGAAPNGRSNRSAGQPTPPPARFSADSSVDGHPVPDARQQATQEQRRASPPLPRGSQQRRVPARRSSPRSSTVLDVPPGVLTRDELTDVVDAVCGPGRDLGSAPGATTGGAHHGTNCLGLASSEFEDVVTELERRCRVPLLREALQCSTPGELVALVNNQVTSGV
jgi:hypothetical protein